MTLPTNIKALRGTAQPCYINDKEPVPERMTDISPPAKLSPKARKHWESIAANLDKSGILAIVDHDALVVYCEIYTQWVDANKKVQKEGMVVPDPRHAGKVRPDGSEVVVHMLSPHFVASLKLVEQMKIMLTQFGMTPASRPKLNSTIDQPKDEYEAFQRRRRMAHEGI